MSKKYPGKIESNVIEILLDLNACKRHLPGFSVSTFAAVGGGTVSHPTAEIYLFKRSVCHGGTEVCCRPEVFARFTVDSLFYFAIGEPEMGPGDSWFESRFLMSKGPNNTLAL